MGTAASYLPIPNLWKGVLGVLGAAFLVPILGGSRRSIILSASGPAAKWWTLVVAAGLLMRFWDLSSFAKWPMFDEAVSLIYSVDNMHGWDGRLSYYFSSLPPLYFWLQALIFKTVGISKASLWILPAVLACGAWLILVQVARMFRTSHETFVVLILAAFSYWWLQPGRYAHSYTLMLFWECLSIWAVAKAWRGPGDPGPVSTFLAGAVVGAGFYTFFSWYWLAPVSLALLAWYHRDAFRRKAVLVGASAMAAGVLAVAWPKVSAFSSGEYGGHVLPLFVEAFQAGHLLESLNHATGLFWTHVDSFRYGPFWGGLLNPAETVLFFLGALGVFFAGRDRVSRYLLAA